MKSPGPWSWPPSFIQKLGQVRKSHAESSVGFPGIFLLVARSNRSSDLELCLPRNSLPRSDRPCVWRCYFPPCIGDQFSPPSPGCKLTRVTGARTAHGGDCLPSFGRATSARITNLERWLLGSSLPGSNCSKGEEFHDRERPLFSAQSPDSAIYRAWMQCAACSGARLIELRRCIS